jgi:uncharacterized damage-inducible protein DinB
MSALSDHFVRLFAHLAWADDKVLQSLRTAGTVLKPIMDLHAHIVGSEHVWLSRINGAAPQLAVWPTLTLDECESRARENAQGFTAVVREATEEFLKREITYRNSAGDQYTSSLDDILTHVALHGSYHRAQIAAALRASGETPAPTDYIAFARGAPAATRR